MNHKGKYEYTKFEKLRAPYLETIKNLEAMNFKFQEVLEDFPRF